ncbi:single-stranded DNA-binding protein [Clostridioides difficile]|nr:single-stranded DNA-binding protein [Clostridioides difficile]
MNTITLVGRLVADAELKYLPNSGTPKNNLFNGSR